MNLAGHRQPQRRRPVGVGGTDGIGPRQEGRVDLGHPGRTGGRGPGHPRRQGLPRQRSREDPVPGREQARTADGSKSRPREAPRTRRKGKRPAQEWADPPLAPLLPPGAPDNSQKKSTPWRSTQHNQDAKGSLAPPRNARGIDQNAQTLAQDATGIAWPTQPLRINRRSYSGHQDAAARDVWSRAAVPGPPRGLVPEASSGCSSLGQARKRVPCTG
jgi:hypothetical protein